jgi:ribosomal protein S18 acetylase RimI-like enzyme
MTTTIRPADQEDAAEIARLSGQLGYPVARDEVRARLAALLADERHHVVVAAREAGVLAGWVHVAHRISLEGGERAELMGLVVDSSVRREGVGAGLVQAAEGWASERDLASITVRSNVTRDEAQAFYDALGYRRSKTQHAYEKALDEE